MSEYNRRASDKVDPDVLLAINEGDADNRHLLRNEFSEAVIVLRSDIAAVKKDVQAGNLADVTEFAQIKAQQHELVTDVAELRRDFDGLEPRVRELEAGALASKEVSALKRWAIGAAVFPSLSILLTFGLYFAQHH
jgi:hypothetical protein